MLVTSLPQLHPAMFSEIPCATERIGLVVAAGAAAGCMELVWGLQRMIHEWYRHTHAAAALQCAAARPTHTTPHHHKQTQSSSVVVVDVCPSGRSCYVFHVGRVNEAKLGNFPEVPSTLHPACRVYAGLVSTGFRL
jgi:hypothetical protein